MLNSEQFQTNGPLISCDDLSSGSPSRFSTEVEIAGMICTTLQFVSRIQDTIKCSGHFFGCSLWPGMQLNSVGSISLLVVIDPLYVGMIIMVV